MYCKNCGNKLSDGSRFCGNCGASLDEASAPPPKREAMRFAEIHLIPKSIRGWAYCYIDDTEYKLASNEVVARVIPGDYWIEAGPNKKSAAFNAANALGSKLTFGVLDYDKLSWARDFITVKSGEVKYFEISHNVVGKFKIEEVEK